METSPLICSENQWTGFYIIETSVMEDIMSRIVDLVSQTLRTAKTHIERIYSKLMDVRGFCSG